MANRLIPAVALAVTAFLCVPAKAQSTDLMDRLMAFNAEHTGLPIPTQYPLVKRADPKTLWHMFAPGREYKPEQQQVVALYGNGFIWLRNDWSADSVRDVSSLLHELVHHQQAHSDRTYQCRGREEKEAYETQIAWLEAQGVSDPLALMEMNALYLTLVTQCRPAWAQ
jgi:hypothetical protein